MVALVALVCSVGNASAQYSSGGFSLDKESLYWGARFGFTAATLSGDLDMGAKVGLTLAGIVGLRVSDTNPVFVESGLYYTERGGKDGSFTAGPNGTGTVDRVGYNCLEIPIVVKYGFKVADGVAILPYLGPYFSYAISGKTKQSATEGVSGKVGTFEEKEALTGGLNRANMGIKLGAGIEYNKLYLELGYQIGITNICKYDDYSGRSNAFTCNFGVNF